MHYINFIFVLLIFVSIFGVGSNEEKITEYSELCPEQTGNFYEPCMKHCASKYSGNVCGQCVHFAKEPKKIINECMCFEGIKCSRANA